MRSQHVAGFVLGIILLAGPCSIEVFAQQEDDLRQVFRTIGRQLAGGQEGGTEESSTDSDDAVEEVDLPSKSIQIKPNEIRFHLLDGSVVTGDLAIDQLTVTTDFGQLTVPVARIRSMRPGLNSYPQLANELQELVAQLADESYDIRQQAQKKLIAFGLPVRSFIEGIDPADDSELKQKLTEIKKALDELADVSDDTEAEPAWISGDTVVTDQFTIVGKIETDQFKLASRYGELSINLADIQRGTREWGSRESVTRSLSISGENFVQRSPKSSKIRVQRGDKITVKVEGTLYLSPWDETASPDGLPDYGSYMGKYPIGAVLARVGKGDWVMVGRDEIFTAPGNGSVEFAVAMMDNFIQNGYDFPGEYKIKVRVDPK